MRFTPDNGKFLACISENDTSSYNLRVKYVVVHIEIFYINGIPDSCPSTK